MTTPLESGPPTRGPRPLKDAVGLILFGILFGIAANAISPRGIPWVGDVSRGAALANRSAEEIKELPPVSELADVQAAVASGDSTLASLDARLHEDYVAGHLPGALNLPVENLDESYAPLKDQLARMDRIIVYCDGGDCELSHDLAEALKGFGHKRVQLFAGGIAAWIEAGEKLTEGEQP